MADSDRIQCSLCLWSTKKRFFKGGRFYGVNAAQSRFLNHVELRHPEEFERLQDVLLEEFENGKFNQGGIYATGND